MINLLKKTSEATNRLFTVLSLVFLVAVLFACTIQVVARYVFNNSLSWTEEFARYCFIWLTMCGTTIATRNGAHAVLDMIVGRFKGLLRRVHRIVINLTMLGISLLFIVQSVSLLRVSSSQLSVAMRIPMAYVYLAIPVGAAGIFIHMLYNLTVLLFPKEGEDGAAKKEGETK